MLPLEEFVKDLLRHNIIQNYKAKRKNVRELYNKEYKTTTGCPFHNFFMELWYYWYVKRYTKIDVYFDEKWINYFMQLEKASASRQREFKESRYITKSKCLLCDTNFQDTTSYRSHLECVKHKLRLQYVKDKTMFEAPKDLCLEILESTNITKVTPPLMVESEPKKTFEVMLHIVNTQSSEVNLLEIIQVNPYITDITVQEQFEKGITLKPSESAVIVLNGYFENSASLIFPLVIVYENNINNTKEYILKEASIEVTSEFSHLGSDSNNTWKKIKNVPYLEMADTIIPGKRPDIYPTFYTETILLKPFKISPSFEKQLTDLIKTYPSFTERGVPISASNHYSIFSSILQLYPNISENEYYSTLMKLLDIEEHQMKVDIRDYDTTSTLSTIKGSSLFELEVPGLAEARPSLLVYDSVYIKVNKDDSHKFQGIVHKVLEKSVYLGLNHRFSESFINGRKYIIEFGFNRRPIKVEKQALQLARDHEIISYFFPKNAVTSPSSETHEIDFYNRDLNVEQKAAVQNILVPSSVPYIIFGPPGTGKTVTVVETVLQVWKNEPSARILVCAPSNAAVNEVASRLIGTIPNMEIFRLLGRIYVQGSDKNMDKLKPIMNIQTDGTFYMPSMDQLLKYRVLLTTIVTAAKIVNGGAPEGHYTHVFIDESGYATETQTLIPIAGILSNAHTKGKVMGKIVLAGDPRQLGPLVHSSFVKYCGYGTSMVERLLDTCKIYSRGTDESYDQRYVTKLIKNYRSHKIILDIPNRLFYDDELVAAGDHFTKFFIGSDHLKNKNFPIIFQHVEGTDARDKDSPSFFNIQEIEEVVGYLGKLVGSRVNGMQITQEYIGVITPYKKQAQKLRKACTMKHWNSLLVGSVEQFQGKEKLVIIISTVRSKNANKFEDIDKTCQMGFLSNPKRFNVALTRARALLIVVGNGNVLKTDRNWSSLIKYCVDNESVAGKHFNLLDSKE